MQIIANANKLPEKYFYVLFIAWIGIYLSHFWWIAEWCFFHWICYRRQLGPDANTHLSKLLLPETHPWPLLLRGSSQAVTTYIQMHSCVPEAAQRLGRRSGAQKGRDVQIHFSITQLTAPWENKSKKCATLKCVQAARDIFNVNPVFWFSKSLIIWLCCGRGVYWSS